MKRESIRLLTGSPSRWPWPGKGSLAPVGADAAGAALPPPWGWEEAPSLPLNKKRDIDELFKSEWMHPKAIPPPLLILPLRSLA
jgi:hypothetical protein